MLMRLNPIIAVGREVGDSDHVLGRPRLAVWSYFRSTRSGIRLLRWQLCEAPARILRHNRDCERKRISIAAPLPVAGRRPSEPGPPRANAPPHSVYSFPRQPPPPASV